jgi:hypothetical protein
VIIGLLDPALFLPRPDRDVEREFGWIARACKEHAIELVAMEYWEQLWREMGRALQARLDRGAKTAVDQVRALGATCKRQVPRLNHDAAAWRAGYDQLFTMPELDASWLERMASATVQAAATRDEVVLFTRRIEGRNLTVHRVGQSTLDENTRWVLHVRPGGVGPLQIRCVHHPRNLKETWTTRLDWRLPSAGHGSRYPFCPRQNWGKGSTKVWGTRESKHCWIDRLDNAWARPNIPGGSGYHWDVFISSLALQETVGLPQINVVEFGSREGTPGHIHHEAGKKPKVSSVGWSCA